MIDLRVTITINREKIILTSFDARLTLQYLRVHISCVCENFHLDRKKFSEHVFIDFRHIQVNSFGIVNFLPTIFILRFNLHKNNLMMRGIFWTVLSSAFRWHSFVLLQSVANENEINFMSLSFKEENESKRIKIKVRILKI